MKTLTKIVIALVLFSACSVQQHIHFNKDGSGHASMKFNFSILNEQLKLESELGNEEDSLQITSAEDGLNEAALFGDSLMVYFDTLAQQMRMVPGISNVKTKFVKDSSCIYMSYNFISPAVISKVYQDQNSILYGESTEPSGRFEKDKRTFEYKSLLPKSETAFENSGNPSVFGDELGGEMFTYELIYSFDQYIKSCNNKSFEIAPDKKSVIWKGSYSELISNPSSLNLVLKLKK